MTGVKDWYVEGDRVLVKPDMMGEMSEGKFGARLWVPEPVREDRRNMGNTGELIALGPAAALCRYLPNGEKVEITNDMLPMRVVHAQYGGVMVETEHPEKKDRHGNPEKVKYRIMRDDDIAMFTDE